MNSTFIPSSWAIWILTIGLVAVIALAVAICAERSKSNGMRRELDSARRQIIWSRAQRDQARGVVLREDLVGRRN